MKKDHNEFMRVKAWLFRHQAPIWEESVAECLFFGLMAWVPGGVLGDKNQKDASTIL